MELETIAEQLETNYRAWAIERRARLDEVLDKPQVSGRITNFISEAARHPTALAETGKGATHLCLALAKLSCVASFKLGLMIGFMLTERTEEENSDPPPLLPGVCPICNGTRAVCLDCGKPQRDCLCENGFNIVTCAGCDGEGYA